MHAILSMKNQNWKSHLFVKYYLENNVTEQMSIILVKCFESAVFPAKIQEILANMRILCEIVHFQ